MRHGALGKFLYLLQNEPMAALGIVAVFILGFGLFWYFVGRHAELPELEKAVTEPGHCAEEARREAERSDRQQRADDAELTRPATGQEELAWDPLGAPLIYEEILEMEQEWGKFRHSTSGCQDDDDDEDEDDGWPTCALYLEALMIDMPCSPRWPLYWFGEWKYEQGLCVRCLRMQLRANATDHLIQATSPQVPE